MASETATAKAPRAILGITLARMGEAAANAAVRMTARAIPTAQAASIVTMGASEGRDEPPELLHPGGELVDHPGTAHQEDDGDAEELRDERERHLLDLGDGLDDRDDQAHHQADREDGAGELEGHEHGTAQDADDRCVRHGVN